MDAWARTMALLAETNPPVAAAVRAAGANRRGDPNVGLLGWLPGPDRRDLCRAAILARSGDRYRYDTDDPDRLAIALAWGVWRRPRRSGARVDEAVIAYARARGHEPVVWLLHVLELQEASA